MSSEIIPYVFTSQIYGIYGERPKILGKINNDWNYRKEDKQLIL